MLGMDQRQIPKQPVFTRQQVDHASAAANGAGEPLNL